MISIYISLSFECKEECENANQVLKVNKIERKSLNLQPGAHPANFKGGSKKMTIPHSGADPENFGRGDEILK